MKNEIENAIVLTNSDATTNAVQVIKQLRKELPWLCPLD